jgi:outer membrane biogenesis lipoprotein LolB
LGNMTTPHRTVRNQQLWRKHCRQLRALAQGIIEGKVSVINGSRKAQVFRQWLHAWDDEDFEVFETVCKKAAHLPTGAARSHWHSEALEEKDEDIRRLEEAYRRRIVRAATVLRAKYT